MADKNRELAEAVVAAVGGSANITSVAGGTLYDKAEICA